MKIRVILPHILRDTQSDRDQLLEKEHVYLKPFFSPDSCYDVEMLDYGSASLETEYDSMLAIPDILRRVKHAEQAGYDGVFISCFDDPGVRAVREIVAIPVVGAFEPALLMAMGLADRIGIVTVLQESLPSTEMKIRQMMTRDRIVSLRHVDIPVCDLIEERTLLPRLVEASKKAITEDGAQVVVLGCTGMKNVAEELMAHLQKNRTVIPVIDPCAAAICMLEGFVRMRVSPSRLTYPKPLKKRRVWWDKERNF